MKSLTTVLSVQASKPLREDPSREKTEQYIKEQWFYRNLEFVHQEVQQLSEEQWLPGINRGAQQARGRKRNTVLSIHLSATSSKTKPNKPNNKQTKINNNKIPNETKPPPKKTNQKTK